MELKIQAIHFDATEKLNAFIAKKAAKLEKTCDNIIKAEFILKVVKPETAKNKETALNVSLPGTDLHAEKVCDTFEEGVDLCVDTLLRQIDKYKVADKARELAEELQRKVTIEELMEETGMSRKMIEDAVRMSGFKIEDIDNNAKDSL